MGVQVTLDAALATYRAIRAITGDDWSAMAVYGKLEIRVPYAAPEAQPEAPAGMTPPPQTGDDDIPF